MIINADNLILGRLSTYVAKKVLLGEKVDIVNCESCVITGDRANIFKNYDRFLKMGIPAKGPFTHRMPDRFVKRSMRGMLPYKKERGRTAFNNIKCHMGIPNDFKNQKIDTINNASVDKVPNLKYVKIKDICIHIGAKLK